MLLLTPAGLAGADIARDTGIRSGTLYPMLARLEDAGWLKSEWEKINPQIEGRPKRRIYTMTTVGRKHARAALSELQP
ncbi:MULTISPECIES: PadR family transcriptional regulator [unclassified Bradyrhizobium]